MADQSQRGRRREANRLVPVVAVPQHLGVCPGVAGEHHERQSHQHHQRRHEADGACGAAPPHAEHEPRQRASGDRQRRKTASSAFDEQPRIEKREQEGHAPQPGGGAWPGGELEQHEKAGQHHRPRTPPRCERFPQSPRGDRQLPDRRCRRRCRAAPLCRVALSPGDTRTTRPRRQAQRRPRRSRASSWGSPARAMPAARAARRAFRTAATAPRRPRRSSAAGRRTTGSARRRWRAQPHPRTASPDARRSSAPQGRKTRTGPRRAWP